MAYQYQPRPYPQAHQYPLLDQQYNPTETMRSFTNAVFNYLDMYHDPKGSQLLEPSKMKALMRYMVPKENVENTIKLSTIFCNATFLAFQIETVFTAHGPSVTRAGFLTLFRSQIMEDPDEAFSNFNACNQAMRLGPPFARSQFPQVPEPRAKQLSLYVQDSIKGTIKDLDWSPVPGGNALAYQQEQLAILKMRADINRRGNAILVGAVSSSVCYSCRSNPCTCLF